MAPKYDHTGVSDTSIIEERIVMPSTFETIDEAMFQWLDERVNIHCETNKGFKKTQIVWVSAERAYQIKNKKEIRDSSGALILPLITLERSAVVKDPTKKGIFWGNIPSIGDKKGGSITIARQINQDKTANFVNADTYRQTRGGGKHQINFPFMKKKQKVVYQTITIPMPSYIDISYNIFLKSEYQQQMNEMLTPFITKTEGINHFIFGKDGHTYEGFVQQNFNQINNVTSLQSDERMYQTKVQINVLGYLIGEDKNQDRPKIVMRENAVEVKIPRERVITEDELEHIDKRGFYIE